MNRLDADALDAIRKVTGRSANGWHDLSQAEYEAADAAVEHVAAVLKRQYDMLASVADLLDASVAAVNNEDAPREAIARVLMSAREKVKAWAVERPDVPAEEGEEMVG